MDTIVKKAMPKGVGVIAVSVVPTKSMKFCAASGLGAASILS